MYTMTIALDAYQKEYHVYPQGFPETILAVLMARNSDSQNPKRIVFMEVLPDAFDAQGRLLDGWGRPFLIRTHKAGAQLRIQSLGKNGKDDGGKYDDKITINEL